MRIKSMRIKNFRSFKECEVHFAPYTSLVGPNGAGKSTILSALNVFFRETEGAITSTSELDIEDFHARDAKDPIEIELTFNELSEEAQKDFKEYFRQNQLIVTAKATFDPDSGFASVKQFGQRLIMDEFRAFFELYNKGGLVGELRDAYGSLMQKYPDLPAPGTKDAMRDALRQYEEQHPNHCVLISSEDQFYGFSKGGNRLAKHIQWVYLPAVKDATKENIEAKNTALGKILARTVRSKVNFSEDLKLLKAETLERYRAIMNSQQNALDEISKSLTQRLSNWAHPEATAKVAWTEDLKKSVQVDDPVAKLIAGEGSFEGELARFGHGLQRSYLLALLQELASVDDALSPTLILGCEEPELYQHPPQARHLSSVLSTLSDQNTQVIVSTHSPYFVSGRYFESIRMVRRDRATRRSQITEVSFQMIADRLAHAQGKKPVKPAAQRAKLHQALQPQLNEMFFASKLIFVEGLEDLAYITSWLVLSNNWDEFRRSGACILPAEKKSYLIEPISIAQSFEIPLFVVFDADGNVTNAGARPKHEADNKALLSLLGGDPAAPFPEKTLWADRFVVWPSNLGDVLRSEVAEKDWADAFGEVTARLGNPEGSFAKNTLHIGEHLEVLLDRGTAIPSLVRLCDCILHFSTQN